MIVVLMNFKKPRILPPVVFMMHIEEITDA